MLGTQSWLNLFDSMDCNVPGSSAMELSRQEYWRADTNHGESRYSKRCMHVYLKADSHISNSRHSKCTHGKGAVWTGKARLAVSFGWTRKSWAGRGGKEVGVDGTVCGEGF